MRPALSLVWGSAVLLAAVVVAVAWGPLEIAWRCYALHRDAERATAEVAEQAGASGLVVRLVGGPHDGAVCTTKTAPGPALEPGARFEVVLPDGAPPRCVPLATVESSGRVLGLFSALILAVVGSFFAMAAWLHRSFTRPVRLARRLSVRAENARCPSCGGSTEEGYVPLLAGLHWRTPDQPTGLPHALAGLPGTSGWRGRRALHALRCPACEVLILQYGAPRSTGRSAGAA